MNLLADDLDYIVEHTQTVWDELRNQCIFITGGTGFFGTWLLETFLWANQKLNLNLSVVVLTRDPKTFSNKAPHLVNNSRIQFHVGDVRNFEFPQGTFSHVIHAATEASAALNQANPRLMHDTIVEGTRQTIACAAQCKVKKVLFLSSGAVYGKQPSGMECISEDYPATPDASNAYATGKYQAEQECIAHAAQHQYEIKIARCFAFVGPYLPLDIHFAIGNFIRDGLAGKDMEISGDGSPYRSYLYTSDLVIWLLTILCHGESGTPYNVGSDEGKTISEIAREVASCFNPEPQVKIAKQIPEGQLPQRYVPSVNKVIKNLKLPERVKLKTAIQKTIAWHKKTTEPR